MEIRSVIIFGSSGQLGTALVHEYRKNKQIKIFAICRKEFDFLDFHKVKKYLQNTPSDLIINAAAFTAVDNAEAKIEEANLMNAAFPALLAGICNDLDIPLVHYSTDYVYSGDGIRPWQESDLAQPVNHYGISKLKGDLAIEASGARHLIFRTSWVYSHIGKNFVTTMLRLAREKKELYIVNDQVGAPTFSVDLARMTAECLRKVDVSAFPSGIYHACNEGETSWYDFAKEIFSQASFMRMPMSLETVFPITSDKYKSLARRPMNSRLNQGKLKHRFALQNRHWKIALAECLGEINENLKVAA